MSVDVKINVREMRLDPRLQEYVEKKVSKLDRYLNGINETRVDLTRSKTARNAADRNVSQITIMGKGFLLRSEERADDIYAAFDLSLDKLQRRMAKYKGKNYRGKGDRRSVAQDVMELEQFEFEKEMDDEEPPSIARKKRFMLYPMDEYEAVEQMNLLGHEDFFIFFNANTNAVNLIYRRRDGSLGLIETEVA